MPVISDKLVGYWLIGSGISVFGIVVFGGLTRLTESGLSITEWRPVTGSLPPSSADAWNEEFEKYKRSPEYNILNPNISLEKFKQIYWMEWIHRQWGRMIGLTFVLPTVYFIACRKVSAPTSLRLVLISSFIGLQGCVGWWMVKSGLREGLFAPGSHPRVSQYRLAVHLGLAFTVYGLILNSGLRVLRIHHLLKSPFKSLEWLEKLNCTPMVRYRVITNGLVGLVFTTALSGAFVAGLDAGLIYNEFPYMGLGLTPPREELWDERYSMKPDKSDLWWRNMTANPSLVQLDHRILATTTAAAVLLFWLGSRTRSIKRALPRDSYQAVNAIFGFMILQVTLGISTLLYLVPIPLAASHQACSLLLLSSVWVLQSRLRTSPHLIQMMKKAAVCAPRPLPTVPAPVKSSSFLL